MALGVNGLPCDWQLECDDLNSRADRILEVEHWSDCSFLVGAEQPVEMKAHKLLLAMASPVFEAMFLGLLAERDQVRIPDCELDVFKTMIKFIYSNNIAINSVETAISLLFTAQKYMLPKLVARCTQYLSDHLSTDNVCRIYELANIIEDDSLTTKCEEMIKAQPVKALTSDAFLDLDISTVLKIFSLEKLEIKSELVLIQAAERYDQALRARADGDTAQRSHEWYQALAKKEKPQDPLENGAGASSSKCTAGGEGGQSPQHPPAHKTAGGEQAAVGAEGAAGAEGAEEKKSPLARPILPVLQKIRFLTLTAKQIAEEKSVVSLLTAEEMAAIFNNICADAGKNTLAMPEGFSTDKAVRQKQGRRWTCVDCHRISWNNDSGESCSEFPGDPCAMVIMKPKKKF